ncbi:hypothetical protein TNCV_565341 [Trichonephila clavipes]|nr:hypothetical protein TNCV_565341 [Trichonephila clavipes]
MRLELEPISSNYPHTTNGKTFELSTDSTCIVPKYWPRESAAVRTSVLKLLKSLVCNLIEEYEGFEEWKKDEEIRTKSFFVKRGGAKKVTNKQFAYYMCYRSGIAIIKSERKRYEKIGGSIKCGKSCPAFMTSIREQQQEAIKITVEYQSVHAGH